MRPLWQVMVDHRGRQWAMISNLTEDVARELSTELNRSARVGEPILFWPEHVSRTWAIGREDTTDEQCSDVRCLGDRDGMDRDDPNNGEVG